MSQRLHFVLALLCALTFPRFTSYADFKEIAASEPFDEPRGGYLKILSAADGTTYFFSMLPKEKITLQKFDPQHKATLRKELKTENNDIMKGELLDVFEIKGHIAVFISDIDGRVPSLYRVLIDKNSFAVLKEEKIVEIPKIKIKVFIGKMPKDFKIALPYFDIFKDEHSDNYAVCAVNTKAENQQERILISHFNAEHQLISQAYCNVPDQPGIKIKHVSMAIEGDKKITTLALTDNNRVFWASLQAGQESFHMEQLDLKGAPGLTDALVQFNPATGEYIILGVRRTGTMGDYKYTSYISRFNPETKAITTVPTNPVKVNTIAKTTYKKNERFDGLPQDLIIHDDGSYTIIYEEADLREQRSSTSSPATGVRTQSWNKYFLKDLGVTTYDKNGNEINAYYLPKNHQINGLRAPFYYGRYKNAAVSLSMGYQYKQFFYFQSPQSEYVMFNDYDDNQEKIEDHSQIKPVLSMNESMAYSFDLTQTSPILKRKALWPAEKKRDYQLALFAATNYNKQTNTVTTLKLDYRTKDMKIVWLQPE